MREDRIFGVCCSWRSRMSMNAFVLYNINRECYTNAPSLILIQYHDFHNINLRKMHAMLSLHSLSHCFLPFLTPISSTSNISSISPGGVHPANPLNFATAPHRSKQSRCNPSISLRCFEIRSLSSRYFFTLLSSQNLKELSYSFQASSKRARSVT